MRNLRFTTNPIPIVINVATPQKTTHLKLYAIEIDNADKQKIPSVAKSNESGFDIFKLL